MDQCQHLLRPILVGQCLHRLQLLQLYMSCMHHQCPVSEWLWLWLNQPWSLPRQLTTSLRVGSRKRLRTYLLRRAGRTQMFFLPPWLRHQLLQRGVVRSGASRLQKLVRTSVLPPKALKPLLQNVGEHVMVLPPLPPHRRLPLRHPLIQHRLPHFPLSNLRRRRLLFHRMHLNGSKMHSQCFRGRTGVLLGMPSFELGQILKSIMSLRRCRFLERRIAPNALKNGCAAGSPPLGDRQVKELLHSNQAS